MRRTGIIVSLVCMTFVSISFWAKAERKFTGPTNGKDTVKKPRVYIPVYLGNSDISGGTISKHEFDSLLKQGLISRDSAGNQYKINGFMFTYLEQNLYEDSSGSKLMMMYDNYVEYCEGNVVSPAISASIYDRTKDGDSVLIDHIDVQNADSLHFAGRHLKFAITR